jgi:hydroxyethylthiazole kinase
MIEKWEWPNAATLTDLNTLHKNGPLVHCLTNIVVANFTANALLAVGAAPIMLENPEEAAEMAQAADAVLINMGTLSLQRTEAMRHASASAHAADIPWVLDPVAAGAVGTRTELSQELLKKRPRVLRGNGSEIMCVAGADIPGKGVESLADSAEALPSAQSIARRYGCVVAVSGQVDHITDGETTIAVPGGDILMTRVTGVGCVLGALIAAFTAVNKDALRAAAAASAVLAEAGLRASGKPSGETRGPGTFALALIDELYWISENARNERPLT